jgi:hypothetical protein
MGGGRKFRGLRARFLFRHFRGAVALQSDVNR